MAMAQDLTRRRCGGDVAGARLPTCASGRDVAVEAVVAPALTRWGLPALIDDVTTTVGGMLDSARQRAERVSLRLTAQPGVIRIEVDDEWSVVPISGSTDAAVAGG